MLMQPKDIANSLREQLKTERVRQRRSQGNLAAAIGMSRKWLSDYERGLIDPGFTSVIALAQALSFRITFDLAQDVDL